MTDDHEFADEAEREEYARMAEMTAHLRPLISSLAYLLVEHGEHDPDEGFERAEFILSHQASQGMTNLVALGCTLVWAKDCLDTLSQRTDPADAGNDSLVSGVVFSHCATECHEACAQALDLIRLMAENDDEAVSAAVAMLAAKDEAAPLAMATLRIAVAFRRGEDATEVVTITVPNDVSELTE